MIIRLFISTLFGFLLHQTYHPTKRFGERWGNLLRYAIGGLALMPVRALLWQGFGKLSNSNDPNGRLAIIDLLALLTLGGGAMIGHLFDKE